MEFVEFKVHLQAEYPVLIPTLAEAIDFIRYNCCLWYELEGRYHDGSWALLVDREASRPRCPIDAVEVRS